MKSSILFSAALAAACFTAALYANGCGATTQLPVTEAPQIAQASQRWHGTTAEELEKGRNAYKERCSGCHSLYSPAKLTEKEWDKVLPIMQRRARAEEDERIWIEKYVRIHAKQ